MVRFVGEGGGRGGAGGAADWRVGHGGGKGEGEGVRGSGRLAGLRSGSLGEERREIVDVVREGALEVHGVEDLLLEVEWDFGLGVWMSKEC